MDARQDDTGDMKVRLKYAYGKFDFGDWGGLSKVNLEAGIVHMAWLDFEQKVNPYRMRDKMFMERSGLFNSADIGVTLAGGFGEDLSDEFQGRSKQLLPRQVRKLGCGCVQRGRVQRQRGERGQDGPGPGHRPASARDVLPGFQFSGLGILGEGNQER